MWGEGATRCQSGEAADLPASCQAAGHASSCFEIRGEELPRARRILLKGRTVARPRRGGRT